MKCILIISSIPDIIFIHADKAFIKHINKVSLKAGFIGEEHYNEDEMDMTALCQIFSPMITSLTYMNDLGNPYSSILCKDGTMFVFSQVCILKGWFPLFCACLAIKTLCMLLINVIALKTPLGCSSIITCYS